MLSLPGIHRCRYWRSGPPCPRSNQPHTPEQSRTRTQEGTSTLSDSRRRSPPSCVHRWLRTSRPRTCAAACRCSPPNSSDRRRRSRNRWRIRAPLLTQIYLFNRLFVGVYIGRIKVCRGVFRGVYIYRLYIHI